MLLLSTLFLAAMLTLKHRQSSTAVVVDKNQRLVAGDEIEEVPAMDGRPGYRSIEEGVKDGIARLTWATRVFKDRGLHRAMSGRCSRIKGAGEFYRKPVLFSCAFFALLLFVAVRGTGRGG